MRFEGARDGHNLVTIGYKSLRHNASMGFDSPNHSDDFIITKTAKSAKATRTHVVYEGEGKSVLPLILAPLP